MMKIWGRAAGALAWVLFCTAAWGQTDGIARMEVTILDYTGTSGQSHYTVAWVTTGTGQFIKSLRKQGPSSWTSSEWGSHCSTWNTARAGSTALDGYTSGTASSYTGTNSPVIQRWNGRNASNVLMPDGEYKFWVQYAENSGQGPVTTSGLLWTKGPVAATNTYANQGANFSNMRVIWTPNTPPTITSAPPPGTATVGVPYSFTCTATGSAPITFSASGLPPGLAMSAAGAISGTPTTAGTYGGTITAANGAQPNATQNFNIVVSVVPTTIAPVELAGLNVVLSGKGPGNGIYTVMQSADVNTPANAWTPIGSGVFDAAGNFRFTNSVGSVTQRFYRLRVP